MARTTNQRRTYSAGERGRNRVRAFPDPKTGIMQLEWREDGRRLQRSLKHRDWDLAKTQADEFAANFAVPGEEPESEPEPLSLGVLFDMYLAEVTPTKGERAQEHDRVTLRMFGQILGADRDPATLSRRDWDRFIKQRSSGTVGPGNPVRARTVERDLKLLLAVLNWAERSNADDGTPLLLRNPLRGCRAPPEKNPMRVVMTAAEYEAMLAAARDMDWRFEVALVLAHETGHRIGAIRQLRWSDVDMALGLIRWRAQTEKTGYEHVTPVTTEAHRALEVARIRNPAIGDSPIFPAPRDPSTSVSRYLMRDWWTRAEASAGLEPRKGRGWHSLRRKFASDLMHKPLRVLCELGGWKTHRTVVECYQQADEDQLREALADRRRA